MTDAGDAITINTSITRCAAYLLPSLDHLPAPVIAERTSQVTGFIIRACSDQSRLMDSDPPARRSCPSRTSPSTWWTPSWPSCRRRPASRPGDDGHTWFEIAQKGAPGHVLSCHHVLSWCCRLRRENGPTSRYVVGVLVLVRELQPEDPQTIGPYRLVGTAWPGRHGRVFLGVSRAGGRWRSRPSGPNWPWILSSGPGSAARSRRRGGSAACSPPRWWTRTWDGPVAWMATAYVPGPSLAEAVDTHGPLTGGLAASAGRGAWPRASTRSTPRAWCTATSSRPTSCWPRTAPGSFDFGISRAVESTMLTQAGLVVGSPGFMSPEQATGYEVGPPE